MRAVYQLANASGSLPIVSSAILQLLFLGLKDQSLAFLAGVWSSSDQESRDLKAISLLHAAAFLEAQILEGDGIDFQTILPSILVALHDSDSQLGQAALECISRIWILADQPFQSVYRLDAIYGRSNGKPELTNSGWLLIICIQKHFNI
jgi:U3 small nucleolar RNA-associated protein 10